MKTIKFLRAALILLGILLSACAPSVNPSAPANVGSGKSLSEVIFTGVIESMNGDQWIINGQTIQVASSVLRDGPFAVGDTVKVEASVAADGAVTAQRVETPSTADAIEMITSTPEATEAPTEASNTSLNSVPGTTTQPLVFDNSGSEAVGTVDSITDTSITINGQTFNFASGVEIKGDIVPGAIVKLHFIVNADGTLSVREIAFADPTQISGNSTDDSSNLDANDDHGGDSNSSDDSSDHDSNDDLGGDDNSGGTSGSGG